MFIDRIYERYFAFDGKIILTADIMIPRQADDAPGRFLSEVSSACLEFARDYLFPMLNARYVSDYGKRTELVAFQYSFLINELYSTEDVISYAYYSLLVANGNVTSCGIRTVTFDKGFILPDSLICRKRRGEPIGLGAEGKPVLVTVENGRLKLIPI